MNSKSCYYIDHSSYLTITNETTALIMDIQVYDVFISTSNMRPTRARLNEIVVPIFDSIIGII